MTELNVSLPLKKFLLISDCPPQWLKLDLYLVRDETITFYVGQSSVAFARVWDHLRSGYKGRSDLGRFINLNWPVSMNFILELFSSKSERFIPQGNNLNAAEQALIEELSPCFNIVLNVHPTPLPEFYISPFTPHISTYFFRYPRSLNRMVREAVRVAEAEERKSWLA